MRSLILMIGAYALYKIVQENSQPAERQLALPLAKPAPRRKNSAAARPRVKATG